MIFLNPPESVRFRNFSAVFSMSGGVVTGGCNILPLAKQCSSTCGIIKYNELRLDMHMPGRGGGIQHTHIRGGNSKIYESEYCQK